MSTSLPSGILIHPAVCPQQTWAENWGESEPLAGVLGPHLTQCGQRRGLPELPPYKWHLDPSSRLVTTYVGRKLGAAVLLLEKGELGHHLTQCGRGRGLPTCQVSS